jgi:phenylpropionate dioxygenase-like ring-hydroxylating dioxygenase large terminal subunit
MSGNCGSRIPSVASIAGANLLTLAVARSGSLCSAQDGDQAMNAPETGFAQDAHVAALGTAPVPAGPYYQSDWFELEREAVFRRAWLNVGHVAEIPNAGDFIVRELEVLGASIIIARGKDGAIRAFHNVCPHRGTQLVDGPAAGSASRFSCRYHMWTFGLDGALISAPDFERFYVEKSDCNLKGVAVDVCGGLIFVNLDPRRCLSLREWIGEELADGMDSTVVARASHYSEYVYEIGANWKLTYDNFQENYHLRFIHPKSGLAGLGKENPYGYPVRYGFHGLHRTQTIWSNPEPQITPTQALTFGRAVAMAMKDGVDFGDNTKQYFALFPSLFTFGSAVQPFTHMVYPLSATRSRGVIRLYWLGADDSASKRFAREYMMATTRDIHAEDRAVIEAGQKGLSSGALSHIHFQEQEVLCRHLMHSVAAQVESYKAETGQ